MRSGISLTPREIDAAPHLELIIRAGSGFYNIDVTHARSRGIRLARIPGPAAQAVAELALGLALVLARRIRWADATMRAGEWRKSDMTGNLLAGKTLGIVGLGNIGTRFAELGVALGWR